MIKNLHSDKYHASDAATFDADKTVTSEGKTYTGQHNMNRHVPDTERPSSHRAHGQVYYDGQGQAVQP